MNILPIVLGFISLLTICSYALVHSFRASVHEKKHYTACLHIEQKAEAVHHKALYKSIKGKDLHPKKTANKIEADKQKTQEKEYQSPRRPFAFPEKGKLNLSSLTQPDMDHTLLTEVACNLIDRLYRFTGVLKESTAEELLSTIIGFVRKDPNATSFEELLTLTESPNPLLYQLVKGTNSYILHEDNRGYPALSDYFCLHHTEKQRPIDFSHASEELLAALFDDPIALMIVAEEEKIWKEKKKHTPLPKGELETLLLRYRKNLSDYEHLLLFGKSAKGEIASFHKDDTTHIQHRR